MSNIQLYVNKEDKTYSIYTDIDSNKINTNIFNDDDYKDLMDENEDFIIKGHNTYITCKDITIEELMVLF